MRDKIRMNSTGTTKEGKKTGYFRTTTKNKKKSPDKLVKKLFDPRAWNEEAGRNGKHVEFKEGKI